MRRERGSVFVFSLAVLAALVGVMAAIASTERLRIKATANRDELIKARMAAMSAVQRAIATFANDLAGATTTTGATSSTGQQTGATTLQDDWAQLGQNGDELVTVGDTTFRMQIVDNCSFVNTGGLTNTWLNNLPLSQEQIDAYLDFTSAGETPRPDGAKDQYYNGLQNPYNAKLGALDSFDQLLQVRYFTPMSLWAPQTNVVSQTTFVAGANGQQPALYDLLTTYSYAPNMQPGPLGQQQRRINVNTATQAQLIQLQLSQRARTAILGNQGQGGGGGGQRPNFATMGALLTAIGPNVQDERIVLNSLTTSNSARISGLINLNTASQNVLATVPNLTPDMVQALVQQQQSGYTQLGDVLNVSGYTGRVLQQTIQYFTVQSSTFTIRVLGKCGSASVAVEATIDINNNTPSLVKMVDVPFTDVIGRWNWNTDTSTDTKLLEAS